jgi:hypothetical protein
MADYKLRLDVDAKLLEKNLEAAVKKAFGKIPSMSGGGMGGGMSGMGGTEKQYQKTMQKLSKTNTKLSLNEVKQREKYIHDMKMVYIKEKAALRAHNIMLEKSGARAHQTFRSLGRLMGGRAGGAVGTGMDIGFQKLAGARSARTSRKNAQTTWDAANSSWGPGPMANISRGQRPESNHDAFNTIMDAGGAMKSKFKGTDRGKAMMKSYGKFKNTGKGKAAGKAMGAAGAVASKVPQLVKLAGIGAALAGGAGLGKMIVDSSPMLKSMLKLLNVGVMLILRPIGDFVGFMLRPLLLEFVKKVAIPAYKSGAGLAKEWGTKMGKIILLLFTNPQEFLKGAVIDPLLNNFAKMGANIQRKLMEIGTYLNPFMNKDEKEDELNRIITTQYDKSNALSDQAINKKYPGFFYDDKGLEGGLLGGIGDTETGKNLQKLQEMTTEELNLGNSKTDKVIEKAKEVGVAVGDLEDKMTEGNVNTAKTAELLDALPEKIAEVLIPAPVATNSEGQTQDEVMEEQRNKFKENPYTGRDKFGQPIQGSQAIESKAAAKQAAAALASSAGVAIISVAGQKILDKYNDWKESNGGGPAVGVRGDKEFGKWNTQVNNDPLVNLGPRAVTLREDAEMWSDAYAEAARLGSEVDDEYQILKTAASSSSQDMEDASCEIEKVLTFSRDAAGNMALMNDVTKLMSDNMLGAYAHVKSRFAQMGYKMVGITGGGSGSSGIAPGGTTPSEELVNSEAKYRMMFGDGGPDVIKTLNSDGAAHYRAMYAAGTPYKDRGQMLSFTKMAKGGVITEKIFGIGASTGQGYMFGEAGPETVTPGIGGTVNNGGGSTFNITINASNVGDIERQLKPAILKMLKESTARAGIV